MNEKLSLITFLLCCNFLNLYSQYEDTIYQDSNNHEYLKFELANKKITKYKFTSYDVTQLENEQSANIDTLYLVKIDSTKNDRTYLFRVYSKDFIDYFEIKDCSSSEQVEFINIKIRHNFSSNKLKVLECNKNSEFLENLLNLNLICMDEQNKSDYMKEYNTKLRDKAHSCKFQNRHLVSGFENLIETFNVPVPKSTDDLNYSLVYNKNDIGLKSNDFIVKKTTSIQDTIVYNIRQSDLQKVSHFEEFSIVKLNKMHLIEYETILWSTKPMSKSEALAKYKLERID